MTEDKNFLEQTETETKPVEPQAYSRRPGGQPHNKNRQVHGGYSALANISDGKPLVGLARDAELAVYNELEANGRYSLVIRNAARLQAACDLFWNAVQKAAEDGDLVALDRYIARFGWLASSSLRAWAQVKSEDSRGDGINAQDVLEVYRNNGNE